MMRFAPCLLLSLVCAWGCDAPQGGGAIDSNGGGSAPPPPATASTDAPQAPPNPSPEGTGDDVNGGDGYEREAAAVGAGKQGRNYGGGVISEPIRQYFRAGQRIQFIQMEQTMRHFKALHDRNPNSHEEFMEKIIQEGGVQLPELPPGERYAYDPETGELMVEKPATN